MLPICGFLAIAQAAQGIPAQEISVQHMRPSKLVEILNQIQPSTVLTADDERGVISVRAGKETVDQYKSYAGLFDVKPRRVRLQVETNSTIDRESNLTDTVVANNRSFTLSESGMGIAVKLATRINDDGTITVFVEPTYQTQKLSTVVRAKNNSDFYLRLVPGGQLEYTAEPAKLPASRTLPTIRVRATIVEDAAPKAK